MLVKKRIILMLGFVLCSVMLLFCLNQTAYGNTANCLGTIELDGPSGHVTEEFNNIDELISLTEKHNPETYEIVIYNDMDFKGKTLVFNKGNDVVFHLGPNKIYTSEPNLMINVNGGSLRMEGDKEYHRGGSVEGPEISFMSHETINVNNQGNFDAIDVSFIFKYDGIIFDKASNQSKFENCYFSGKNSVAIYFKDNFDKIGQPHLFFESCRFNDVKTGIINNYNNSLLVISSCAFNNSNDTALDCGTKDSQTIIENTEFNSCKGNGGGAIAAGGFNNTITFDSVKITKCVASDIRANKDANTDGYGGSGGALYLGGEEEKIFFNNSYIENCIANQYGGAISCLAKKSDIVLDNTTIEGCSTNVEDGGAFYVRGSNVNITGVNNSTIKSCHSAGCGGAIHTSIDTDCGNNVTIKDLNFINNSCDNEGGAIKTRGKYNIITNCYFEGNSSKNKGGAVYGYSGLVWGRETETQMNGCSFYNNSSSTEDTCKTVYLSYWRDYHVSNNKLYYDTNEPNSSETELGIDDYSPYFETVKR